MTLTVDQQKLIEGNNIVVLATANKYGQPRAVLVKVNVVQGNKIVVTDNRMNVTSQNIVENPLISLLAFNKDYSSFLRISGRAMHYTDQSHIDWAASLETNKNWEPKGVVEIIIDNVEESR